MSKHKSRHASGNGPIAAAPPEGEAPAEVSGTASAHAQDVREEGPAEEERHRLVAVAAYYHAEHRGFAPGCEMDDWIEAEAEIQEAGGSQSG